MSQKTQAKTRKPRRIRWFHILTLIVMTILFIFFIVPAAQLRSEDYTTDPLSGTDAAAMENGMVFRQDILQKSHAILSSIGIRFGTYDRVNRGTLTVKLYENDAEIAAWTVPTKELVDGEMRDFELDEPHPMMGDAVYYFTISDAYRGRNMISVWMDKNHVSGYYINGELQSRGTICYTQTYHFPKALMTRLLCIGYVMMVVGIALFFILYQNRKRIATIGSSLITKCNFAWPFSTSKVTVWDWIIFALIAGFCYFTMQHGDILHTGASSFALLRGHVLDFYEYNAKYLGGNAYMISTYVMFAIWNIPLAVLGVMGPPSMVQSYATLMWFKGLPTFLFVMSGILFYKICKKCEKKTGINAKWGTFLFLLTPTAFYSQFMFGQYDVLTVFFMVLGLKILLDEKEESLGWFSFLFGVATTFKYHALLFFVPVLLYKEKRVTKLIKNAVLFLLPVALANLPYLRSPHFTSGVENFGAVDYFFKASVEYYVGDMWRIYLVPLLWVILCAYAYTRRTADDFLDRLRVIAYVTGLVAWLAFGIVFWHPQWFMIATPFLVLGLIVSNRRHVICLLDIALTMAFMSFVESLFIGMTQGFFGLGCFGSMVSNRQLLSPRNLGQFCLLKDSNVAFTVISGLLLARALLVRPEWEAKQLTCSRRTEALWFRIRGFVGIAMLVVPMVICLIAEIHTPTFTYSIHVDEANGKAIFEANTAAEFDNFTVAIWSDENGQDDLKWYPVREVEDDVWQAEIDLTENHGALGLYYLHLYEYPEGVPTLITANTFNVNALPEPEAASAD